MYPGVQPAKKINLAQHIKKPCLSRFCYVRSDNLFFFISLFLFISLVILCTILRPQDMTPGIACDSKSPVTDRLGPLVRPRFPTWYLADSRAWPSPLWAYNTFSIILFFSLRLVSLPILFYSTPFYSIASLISFASIRFHLIPFDSFLFYSLRLDISLVISGSHCI